jgi:outer membrane protein assembly factor BamB
MPGNGKVYVCHAAEDTAVCLPVLAALDAWSIDYFFDANVPTGMVTQLPDGNQQELAERDVLLRVCTAALQRSMTAGYEVNAFRSLQAEDKRRGKGERRTLINLILDPNYTRDPIDNATLFVDGTTRPRPEWLADLGRAFGASTVPSRYSRRSLLAVGGSALVTVAALSATGALLLDYRSRTTQPKYLPGQAVWHRTFGTKIPPGPTAVDGVVYVVSDAGCAAYHAVSGQNIWTNAVQLPQNSASCLVADGVVYFGVDSQILALRASDGNKRWAWAVDDGGNESLAGSVANGLVYVLSNGGTLYALDARDGQPRWKATIGTYVDPFNQFFSAPIASAGVVCIGSPGHSVRGYGAPDGTLKWTYLTHGPIHSSPAVDGTTAYVGSLDGALYALDLQHGTLRWKFQTGGSIYGSPLAQDGIVFVGSRDGYFYAIDATTGRAFWGAQPNASGSSQVDGTPVVVNTTVYLTVGTVVYGYRAVDGVQTLAFTTDTKDGENATDVTTTDGLLFYGTQTKSTNSMTVFAIGG